MKKYMNLLLVLCMVFAMLFSFVACDDDDDDDDDGKSTDVVTDDFTQYSKGVTVQADSNSPTGYTATFIYEEESEYDGITGEITLVELYSDCMMLFYYPSGTEGSISADYAYNPEDYEPGMYPAGGSTSVAYYVDMEEFEDGLWGVQVPLTSGATVYNFQVTDSDGNTKSRLDDPNNPTLTNTATGISSLSSMVYVPYNATYQGTGEWADRSVELPNSKAGTVETISYTGTSSDERGLAVYLPYGYDSSRSTPYNVLYLSHGASGDSTGNELRWMNEGAVANIMDNLIADGKIDPFVVVTMNNQDLSWSFSTIEAEQELIVAEIEENYNVSTDRSGKAFAGLSMGGYTTTNFLINDYDDYSYYGIWSYCNTSTSSGLGDTDVTDTLASYIKEGNDINILFGAGYWDYLLSYVKNGQDLINDALGTEYDLYEVPGAHDWETWQLIYAYAAENFFWK